MAEREFAPRPIILLNTEGVQGALVLSPIVEAPELVAKYLPEGLDKEPEVEGKIRTLSYLIRQRISCFGDDSLPGHENVDWELGRRSYAINRYLEDHNLKEKNHLENIPGEAHLAETS